MDYGHVLFVTTACLLMMFSGVFGKPRVFSESRNLTSGDKPCPQWNYCQETCVINGKDGHCTAGFVRCYCKPYSYGEDQGSKYLQLAKEMSMEKLRRSFVENQEQKRDEHLKL